MFIVFVWKLENEKKVNVFVILLILTRLFLFLSTMMLLFLFFQLLHATSFSDGVLLTFQASVTGPTSALSWNSSASHCTWFRVTSDREHVNALRLSLLSISGTNKLVNLLFFHTSLPHPYLPHHTLEPLTRFAEMKNLTMLNLFQNRLPETIPVLVGHYTRIAWEV